MNLWKIMSWRIDWFLFIHSPIYLFIFYLFIYLFVYLFIIYLTLFNHFFIQLFDLFIQWCNCLIINWLRIVPPPQFCSILWNFLSKSIFRTLLYTLPLFKLKQKLFSQNFTNLRGWHQTCSSCFAKSHSGLLPK